jgi:hypothetical protein
LALADATLSQAARMQPDTGSVATRGGIACAWRQRDPPSEASHPHSPSGRNGRLGEERGRCAHGVMLYILAIAAQRRTDRRARAAVAFDLSGGAGRAGGRNGTKAAR